MSDWEEIFEELKMELLNEKQENYILPYMKLHETETQLGYGHVVINSKIVITGIRIMKSQKSPGTFYMSLPVLPKERDYLEICRMDKKLYREIFKSVVKNLLNQQMNQSIKEDAIEVEIKLVQRGKFVAYANVACEGVKFSHICVLQGKDKMFVSFPQIKTEIGYKDIVYFSTAGLREQVTNKVLKECQKLLEKTETPDCKKTLGGL